MGSHYLIQRRDKTCQSINGTCYGWVQCKNGIDLYILNVELDFTVILGLPFEKYSRKCYFPFSSFFSDASMLLLPILKSLNEIWNNISSLYQEAVNNIEFEIQRGTLHITSIYVRYRILAMSVCQRCVLPRVVKWREGIIGNCWTKLDIWIFCEAHRSRYADDVTFR